MQCADSTFMNTTFAHEHSYMTHFRYTDKYRTDGVTSNSIPIHLPPYEKSSIYVISDINISKGFLPGIKHI